MPAHLSRTESLVLSCAVDTAGVHVETAEAAAARELTLFDLGIDAAGVRELAALLCENFPLPAAGAPLLSDLLLTGPSVATIARHIEVQLNAPKTAEPRARAKYSAPPSASPSSRSSVLALASVCAFALATPAAAAAVYAPDQLGFELDDLGCIKDFDSAVDYFPASRRAIFTNGLSLVPKDEQYAEDFSIDYYKTYKIVRNLRACPTLPCSVGLYVLHHCGAPRQFDGLPDYAVNASVFTVPVHSWATSDTTAISFAESLNVGHEAALTDISYVSSSCFQRRYGCGALPDAAGWSEAYGEKLAELNVELNLKATSFCTQDRPIDVCFDATSDPGMLHRVEWVKFVAAFFNKEPLANAVFQGIEQRFLAVMSAVLAAREGGGAPPVCAFVSKSWYNDFRVNRAVYKLEALTSAGGLPLSAASITPHCNITGAPYADANTHVCATTEQFKEVLKQVDILFDDNYPADGYPAYTLADFKEAFNLTRDDPNDYPFLKAKTLYRLDGSISKPKSNYGNDWFESAVMHADKVLADLATVITPEAEIDLAAFPHQHSFVRNLALGEMPYLIGASDCDDAYSVCPGETPPSKPKREVELNYCTDKICMISQPPPPPPVILASDWQPLANEAGWKPCTKAVSHVRRLALNVAGALWGPSGAKHSADDDDN